MKKVLLFLLPLLFFMFEGCKNSDPAPDYSLQVKGIYSVSQIEQNGQVINLPSNGVTMGITVNSSGVNKIDLMMKSNVSTTSQSFTDLTIKNEDRLNYYSGSTKYGYFQGDKLYFSLKDSDGTYITITAYK